MLVLGVDPGTHNLGWGVVRAEGNRMKHIAHGVLKAPSAKPLASRLYVLDQGLAELIDRYKPDCGSVESLFFHKDAQAAAKLGHARGIVLLSLARAGVPVAEYPPARVKSMIAGNGRAEKQQVALMIKALLCLEELPAFDASDALALAVTHLRRAPLDAQLAARQAENPELARILAKGGRRRRRLAKQPKVLSSR